MPSIGLSRVFVATLAGVDSMNDNIARSRAVFQQRSAQPVQARIGLLHQAARGIRGMRHDTELVEGDAGLKQVLGAALDGRRRHVDAHRADSWPQRVVCAQVCDQLTYGLRVAAFGHEQRLAFIGVGGQRQVVVAAPAGGLVDRKRGDLRQAGLRQRQLDIALADRGHPVPGFARQAGHRGKRHHAAQRQYQRLEQQRAAVQVLEPLRFDLGDLAVGHPQPRHSDLEVALVLEEVQMPQPLELGVMRRVLAGLRWVREAAAGGEVHLDGQLPRHGVKPNRFDGPWGADAQRLFEQPLPANHRLSPRPSPLSRQTRPCSSVFLPCRVKCAATPGLQPPLTRSAAHLIHSKFKRGLKSDCPYEIFV